MKGNITQSYSVELFQFSTCKNTLIYYSNKEKLKKENFKMYP